MPRQIMAPLAGVTLLAVTLTGCGSSTKLLPAQGTVRAEGQPVAGALVTFRCEQPAKVATGTTDAQGRFQLTTYPDGKGAVAGKHRVTVTKFPAPSGTAAAGSSMEDMLKKPAAQAAPQNQLPAKYADPAQSGLEFTVTAGGANDFTIELTK